MKYHYTYRISNIVLNKHYYGVRTSSCSPELDLGVKYFSSSSDKLFKEDQKKNPQNYKYKVIKVSENRKEALEMEVKLHEKFDVSSNQSFYNRSKQTSIGWDTTGLKYDKNSDFYKETYGKIVKCPHCKKEGKINLMRQWHFERCVKHPTNSMKNIEYMKGVSERKKNKNPMMGKYGKNNPKSQKYTLFDNNGEIVFECYGAEVKEKIEEYGIPQTMRYCDGKYTWKRGSKNKYKKFEGWELKSNKWQRN